MTDTNPQVRCPQCGSIKLWRDGLHRRKKNAVQRWLCRDCGYRFLNPRKKRNYDAGAGENVQKIPPLPLRMADEPVSAHRVGAWNCQVKNLIKPRKAETMKFFERLQAGKAETKENPPVIEVKGRIVEYSFWLLKQGYAKSTITGRRKLLKILVKRGANLYDPESVKETIARQKWSAGRKVNAVDAYTCFLRMSGKNWDPPRYKRVRKLPFIPSENEVDQLIAGCGKKTATLLQLLKETGMRIGEAWKLHWPEIDFVNNTVRVTPEKGSNPRIFKASNKLMAMLNAVKNQSNSDKVFGKSLKSQARLFHKQRRRIAGKLQNPRILRISFHTFRHFKATMEYHKTKDILHVMKVLGHKNINNTLVYTQLVDFGHDEYIVRVSHNIQEDEELI
ncbi:MAG: tyrosine-type recombinase/integrase, partial [Candidatus Bathyarchaeota archaeon]